MQQSHPRSPSAATPKQKSKTWATPRSSRQGSDSRPKISTTSQSDEAPAVIDVKEKEKALRGTFLAFLLRFYLPFGFLQLVWSVGWTISAVIVRRLRFGALRPRWSWINELMVEWLQANFTWHLQRALRVPLTPHPLAPLILPGRRMGADSDRQKNEMSEAQIRSYCAIKMLRAWLEMVPKVPYWPRATCQHHVNIRLPTDIQAAYPAINSQLYAPIQLDEICHRSVPHDTRRAVLFVHGGGFCFSMEMAWRGLCVHYSRHLKARVFAVQYRLAPEHPFPAAINDVFAAYLWLILPKFRGGCGYDPDNVVLIGESAGGGACVSMLLHLHALLSARKSSMLTPVKMFTQEKADNGGQWEPIGPRALYLQSPWLDITCESVDIRTGTPVVQQHLEIDHEDDTDFSENSWLRNGKMDTLTVPTHPFDFSHNYVFGMRWQGERDLRRVARNPLISPIFADTSKLYACLPPVILQIGAKESLHDEGILFADKLNQYARSRAVPSLDEPWLRHRPHRKRTGEVIPVSPVSFEVPVKCDVYEDMVHVFQLFSMFDDFTAHLAIQRGCAFLEQCCLETTSD